jgi:hypothetical protein
MTYSITITDKKEAITMVVGDDQTTLTMTGKEPHTRVHVVGAPGVKYPKDGPVGVPAADKIEFYWGVIGKHCIYENRPITLTRTDLGLQVTYMALFTETVAADKPVTYTVYKYGGDWRWRKET